MSSTTKDQKTNVRRTRRRGRKTRSRDCVARRSCNNGGGTCSSKVSGKLEALKKLIPGHEGEIVKTDQLFQQTADYIVLLRTQVVLLQKLIEFYGSADSEHAVS
ncbi:transcription factor UPBEAT-like protein [Parasponia andersonii]|uniref:Transcription factor UPBEAT-like protein n=1 Tax=Parasponia andersonii TaxID=3476 RepID=A0A2P5AW87_PARAD|nr:transcription factor UPBEAT-like protein [Parasponia andersonii]